MLEVPSTGDPPVGVKVSSVARHRGEAREEVARVRLAVGDVGIGGLEAEDQDTPASGLFGVVPRSARSEVGRALRSRPGRRRSTRSRRPGW